MTNSVNQIFEGHCRHRRQNIYEQAEVFKCHERDVHKQCSHKQTYEVDISQILQSKNYLDT